MGDSSKLNLRIAGEENLILKAIQEIDGINNLESLGVREPGTIDLIVEADPDVDIRRPLFHAMSKASCPILMMKSLDMTLEDIFLQVTTQEEEVR